MNILVIGSGGREHALVWKIAQSPRVKKIYCAPGNAGIDTLARCVPIAADQVEDLKAFAVQEKIDLTVVGPEAPLAMGIANEFRKAKLKIFGPTQGAAQLEASKGFAKKLMIRQGIPTPQSRSFEDLPSAMTYLEGHSLPLVVKADGLAQGKGVVIASSLEEARQAVQRMLAERVFGEAGQRVLIEEFLEGEEVSIMAFTDGKTVVPMVPAQDHKRVGEGDTGPNTGGMGAYAPAPLATKGFQTTILHQVLYPIVEGLSQIGCPFQGVVYAGLMVVNDQPYVLEFNARFGDPETQVVLPLLKTDLVDVLEAVVEHRLDQVTVEWHDKAATCVVLASGGYPGAYHKGKPIRGLPASTSLDDVLVFHAGTKREGADIVTAGGRVLGVASIGPDLHLATTRAYQAMQDISFEGCHYRTDIAKRALGTAREGQ